MSLEQECFLEILSNYLNDNDSVLPIEANATQICAIARNHQLAPIIYYQCKLSELQNSYVYQLSNFCKSKKIVKAFEQAIGDIPHIFFKGAVVARLFAQPALRSMGDVDVLIHPEDAEVVYYKLKENQFQLDGIPSTVWTYKKSGIILEVHTQMIHPSEGNQIIEDYFNSAWDYKIDNELDWNYHFLYLLAHLRQHIIEHGVGFRQFMDLAIISKKKNDLNWEWIRLEAKKLGLEDFLLKVIALNEKWFNIKSKASVELNEDFYKNITQYIFKNGVFGFNNIENDKSQLTRRAIFNDTSVSRACIVNFIGEAFPSYYTMMRLPYCQYIKRHKWLLPIGWIHRFFYRVFEKESRDSFKRRAVVIKDEDAERKINLLRDFGL